MRKVFFNKAFIISSMTSLLLLVTGCHPSPDSNAAQSTTEKTTLKIGFVKLTDMAPLAVAVSPTRSTTQLEAVIYTRTKR